MQLLMIWILIQPWVMQKLVHMHLVWFWIMGVLPAWVLVYKRMTGCTVFRLHDSLFRLGVLVVTLGVAIFQKFRLEKNRRMSFQKQLLKKDASKQIYGILAYMMPKHVIVPLLKQVQNMSDTGKGCISDAVPRVSVLFVLISEFDKLIQRKTPNELLAFLNKQFTNMDQICARNRVTKIETVCEEYVACVGVVPDDKEENDRDGHSPLLMRLLRTAEQILKMQTREVKFKMGIHSGPIVAGVIGTKLPRYRLFGDTINLAARMMQKSEPGTLQFGIETYGDLPEEMGPLVKLRGDIEMKGRGKMTTYTFETTTCTLAVAAMPTEISTAKSFEVHRKDLELEQNFKEALQQLQSSDSLSGKSHRYSSSDKYGFTPELEKAWFRWYNQHTICHKIVRRLGTQAIVLVVVSGLELQVFVMEEPFTLWGVDYKSKSEYWRESQFIYCRGFVLLGLLLSWFLAEKTNWMERHPTTVQVTLMFKSWINIVLLYFSYEALFITNTTSFEIRMNMSKHFPVPMDQTLTLNFVLFVFLFARPHALLFFTSLSFLPLTWAVICIPDLYHIIRNIYPSLGDDSWGTWHSMYSARSDLFLMIMVLLIVLVAHEEEQASRSRYKSMCVVEATTEKTSCILNMLMPPLVVKQLQNGIVPHTYRHATITQSDLCGFTKIASTLTPDEVLDFISQIFGAFDRLTDEYQVYKVETIGDAYVAGVAEQPLTEKNMPIQVLLFGLEMVREVDKWAMSKKVNVSCRVGIHHGECIGGIVGTDMQRYHLFGDLLVGLEILESTAPEGRVQVSEACKLELDRQLQDKKDALWKEELSFQRNFEDCLKTSKGEVHTFDEVGGRTYLVKSNDKLRCLESNVIG